MDIILQLFTALKLKGHAGEKFTFECPRCNHEVKAIKRKDGRVFSMCGSGCFKMSL